MLDQRMSDTAQTNWFSSTHWSTVMAAGDRGSAHSAAALEKLCRTYWYPLYAYVRHRGHAIPDAEDLTQGFFAGFLAKDYLSRLQPEKGRFRAYLLTSLNHFLADEWDRRTRHKRGGGQTPISIDGLAAEANYGESLADPASPDRVYDRRWALALVHQVLDQLREDYRVQGKTHFFERLKAFLIEDRCEVSYSETAAELGMTDGAVRVAVHRLRRRYGDLLRREIANTVSDEDDIEAEMRDLLAALSG